jgi:hypothetical protein
MDSNKTNPLRPNFQNSIRAGFNAIFDKKASFVIIEHLSNSGHFSIGEKNKILVDCIEIGRNPNCAISYSESDKTVSRLHAVIGKEEGNWVLYNKSETNPTLLNNRPVLDRWFLKHNDLIQFSVEGPKVRFLIPSDSSVNNINFTQRLHLFREQALRPYRKALRLIIGLLVFLIATGGIVFYSGFSEIFKQKKLLTELGIDFSSLEKNLTEAKELTEVQITEIRENTKNYESEMIEAIARLNNRANQIADLENQIGNIDKAMLEVQNKLKDDYYADVLDLYQDVYYLEIKTNHLVSADGRRWPYSESWECSGFLLEDGKFVTARHCIESWPFERNELNVRMSTAGLTFGGVVIAKNSAGRTIEIPLQNFVIPDKTNDRILRLSNLLLLTDPGPSYDIAYAQTNISGNLKANPNLSTSLSVGNPLVVLGFPTGIGGDISRVINPVFSQTTVARNGLEYLDGYYPFVSVTNRNFAEGSSGGPVLLKRGENNYEVIGVISAGIGGAVGVICPISAIR